MGDGRWETGRPKIPEIRRAENTLTRGRENGILSPQNEDGGARGGELRSYPLHLIRIAPA